MTQQESKPQKNEGVKRQLQAIEYVDVEPAEFGGEDLHPWQTRRRAVLRVTAQYTADLTAMSDEQARAYINHVLKIHVGRLLYGELSEELRKLARARQENSELTNVLYKHFEAGNLSEETFRQLMGFDLLDFAYEIGNEYEPTPVNDFDGDPWERWKREGGGPV